MNEEFLKYQVQAFPSFKLDWYYTTTPSDDASWTLIGTSKNELYVVHQVPVSGEIKKDGFEESTTFFHSTFFISCLAAKGQGNKDGQTDPDAIVEKIFEKFRGLSVTKVKGDKAMEYWGLNLPTDDKYRSRYGLFKFENGRCGEWSGLFLDMLKLHGIKSANKLTAYHQEAIATKLDGYLNAETETTAINSATSFFTGLFTNGSIKFIRNSENGKIRSYIFVKKYNFTMIPPPRDFFWNSSFIDINTSYVDVGNKKLFAADLEGVSAQGFENKNPVSAFTNHAIVMYKKKDGNITYYDPSYGKPSTGAYASLNDYETDAIAGFGAVLEYAVGAATVQFLWIYKDKTDHPSQQLTFK